MANLGVTSDHTVRCANHSSLRQTDQNVERKTSVSQKSHNEHPKSLHLSCLSCDFFPDQLLWLGMQCLPQLLAPLSQMMGQTPQAAVITMFEVNQLARTPCMSFYTVVSLHTQCATGLWSHLHFLTCYSRILRCTLHLHTSLGACVRT